MAFISSYTYYAHEGPRRHCHSHGHIIIVLTQTFYMRFSGREYRLSPRQIGFVSPGVPHEYGGNGQTLTLNIPAEMIKSTDLLFLTEHCVLEINEKLEPLISLIKQEVENSRTHSDSLRYLFYYLYDKFVEQYRMPSLQYMHENYADDIHITRLAALENYNISYYTSWFKKRIGCTPSEYLQMVRIDKAKEILATTRYRIIDVAMQVGYMNSSSFTRTFREIVGVTPGQYRRQAIEATGTLAEASKAPSETRESLLGGAGAGTQLKTYKITEDAVTEQDEREENL